MDCERSVITMTLLQLDYLVYKIGNCVMTLYAETSIRPVSMEVLLRVS